MSTGNPQFHPNLSSSNVNESFKSAQKIKWAQKLKEIEKITDGLGKGIEEGIEETVVAFNIHGIPTSQSCEGHVDLHTEDYQPAMAPWVEIYPEEPEQEGWQHNDQLREKVEIESDRYLAKVTNFLREFYANQQVPADVKLVIDPIAYGFRVQSKGLEDLKDPNDKDQQEKAKKYKEEMERFTSFLKEKFLGGEL